VRHYFRRSGKRTTLRGPFGSAEFWADYNACLAELPDTAQKPQPRAQAREGSFAALAALYFASSAYRGLAASSRTNYRRVIEAFCVDHGHRLVSQFKREHAEIIIGELSEKPGAGTVLLKRIRTRSASRSRSNGSTTIRRLASKPINRKNFIHGQTRSWSNSRHVGLRGQSNASPIPSCSTPANAVRTRT
jgi:hypothetical protein